MTRPATLVPLLALVCACSSSGGRRDAVGMRLSIPDDGPLRIVQDAHVTPGDYVLPPRGDEGRSGVVVLRGLNGVTLDLTDVWLRGTPAGTDLDGNTGWGVVIEGCSDVTLRGGRIGGYMVCVDVRDSRRVTVEDVTFDGWFSQRLRSTPAAEDQADWLRPHENDADEWVSKYGGAVSFTDCENVTVRGCRGRRGQNGILFTRTSGSEVYDNDFSFLSGWGIGMYRSSNNVVSHNVFDYCVRGYSHDVYSRGQDSAGILMFERCCDNVVAFNSATHSGDGVFLYGGKDIVYGLGRERGETEVGGGDRNLFYGNDLRYSPANGLEATFSNRNLVIENDLSGCAQHGVWGGYSSDMLVLKNTIDDVAEGGVTIEHGQDCVIAENSFRRGNMAVELYWDPDPYVDGPFGEHNDTDSRDHWLIGNVFVDNVQEVVLKKTSRVRFFDNDWDTSGRMPYVNRLAADAQPDLDMETVRGWMADRDGALPTGHIAETTLAEWTGRYPELLDEHGNTPAPTVPGEQTTRAEERGLRVGDRSTIIMGEWGPWDHRSGERRPEPPKPGKLFAGVSWRAVWFRWTELEDGDPRGDLRKWRALADRPLVRKTTSHWVDPWGDDDVRAVVGGSLFGLIAETTIALDRAGRYELGVTSDDGVRVLLDGEEVYAEWNQQGALRGTVEIDIDAGVHTFVLEYFQVDGATALALELEYAGPQ